MALLKPTNIRVKNNNIGDGFVQITWDDPNGATTAFVNIKNSAGTTLTRSSDVATDSAVVRGGETVIVNVQNSTHSSVADSDPFVVPAAGSATITAEAHLEAALGQPCPPGTVIGIVNIDPQKTVQSDGSLA